MQKVLRRQKWALVILWITTIGLLFSSVTIALLTYLTNTTGLDVVLFTIFTVAIFLSFLANILLFYWWRKKWLFSSKKVISSIAELSPTLEENFLNGTIFFNQLGEITYISNLLKDHGFNKFLGEPLEELKIDPRKIHQIINHEGKRYSATINHGLKTIVLKDITELENIKSFFNRSVPFVFTIMVDFYLELSKEGFETTKANIQILENLSNWTNKVGAVFLNPHTLSSPIIIIGKWGSVNEVILNDKLNAIAKKNIKFPNQIHLTMGVSYGNKDYSRLQKQSKSAFDIARNRGGNQIVIIKNNNDVEYIGQSSVSEQSSSKSSLKFYFDYINEKTFNIKEIIITAHKFADVDALASTLALADFFISGGKTVLIALETFDDTTQEIFKNLPLKIKKLFTTEKKAIPLVTKRTALFICDVAEKSRTQAEKIISHLDKDDIFVIDHHRIGENIINSKVENMFIDTKSSSTSQMVTEMIEQYKISDILSKEIATLLLAGIYLDTSELKRNTGPRTFETISFLLRNGANLQVALEILKPSSGKINLISTALKKNVKIGENVLFSSLPESMTISISESAFLTNRLLEFKNIEAAFLLAKLKDGNYKLTARSHKNFNVQLVCEALGGGGHFNAATAIFKPKKAISIETLSKKINLEIKKTQKTIRKTKGN